MTTMTTETMTSPVSPATEALHEVVRASLRVVAEVWAHPEAEGDDFTVDYASEALALAACRLTTIIDALPKEFRPLGWRAPPT